MLEQKTGWENILHTEKSALEPVLQTSVAKKRRKGKKGLNAT